DRLGSGVAPADRGDPRAPWPHAFLEPLPRRPGGAASRRLAAILAQHAAQKPRAFARARLLVLDPAADFAPVHAARFVDLAAHGLRRCIETLLLHLPVPAGSQRDDCIL